MINWYPKKVFLLSGGVDSSIMVDSFGEKGNSICVHFDYGQPASEKERIASLETMKKTGVLVQILTAQLSTKEMNTGTRSSGSRVIPFRNLAMLAITASNYPNSEIYIGCTANDQKDYADCRPSFIALVNWLIRICGYKAKVIAPYISKTKKQIIEESDFDISLSWSCYQPDEEGNQCGHCNSCIEQKRAITV